MPDNSIKIIQQGNEWLVERNGNAPEKLGSDPDVARSQLVQFIDQFLPNVQRPLAGEPAQPKTPAEDAETTPTTKSKHDAPLTHKRRAA